MSSLIGRKVVSARIHAGVLMKDIGNLTSPITPDSAQFKGKLEITVVENGILVKSLLKGKPSELFIPDGNIQSLQLANEENSKSQKAD